MFVDNPAMARANTAVELTPTHEIHQAQDVEDEQGKKLCKMNTLSLTDIILVFRKWRDAYQGK